MFSHFLDMDLCKTPYLSDDQYQDFSTPTVLGVSPEIQPESSTVLVTTSLHTKW